jgi:structural maintenance of chromosome 2
MISQHFSQSQFIIISLKDGMFNNANVLFKTSFVDGVSKVERNILKKNDGRNGKNHENNENKNNMMIIEQRG